MTSLLPKDIDIEDVRREFAKTGVLLPVMSHAAIQPVATPTINPDLFNGVTFGINRIMEYAGGKNVQGLQENAAESGRAVIARAEQAGTIRLPLFDKLRVWRESVTYKMVWFLKNYMPAGQIIRVIGNDDDVQYVNIDDDTLNTLSEIKYDIVIDEASKSDTIKERNFQQVIELQARTNMPPEVFLPLAIEFSSLPQSKRNQITQMMAVNQQYQQQKAEQEKQQKLTEEVQDAYTKKKIRESIEMGEQLQEQTQELKKHEKSIRTKLDDIQKLEQQLEGTNLSVAQKNEALNKFNTPAELGRLSEVDIQALR
jgi:hypothetical protein